MYLQSELVEILQRNRFEVIDEVTLNDHLFHFGCFFFPGSLFERVIAVANKPAEIDRTVICRSTAVVLSGHLGHFLLQLVLGLTLGHLRLRAKNDRDFLCLLFSMDRVKQYPAEEPIPLFPAKADPTPLMRFTRPFLSFLWGNKWAAPILPTLATQCGEAFPFIDEFLDFACPIPKSAVSDPNDR